MLPEQTGMTEEKYVKGLKKLKKLVLIYVKANAKLKKKNKKLKKKLKKK